MTYKKYIKTADLSPEEREIRNKKSRESYLRNKPNKLKYMKNQYYLNRESKIEYVKKHYHSIKHTLDNTKINENQRKYHLKLYATNTHFKVKTVLRNNINQCLNYGYRNKSVEYVLGCNMDFFRDYLESLFLPGMSWDNRSEWHIDHIVPAKHFDLTILADIKKCFNYSNFQPLWKYDNLSKSAK
jgi:hypothetical protein